MAKPRGRSQLPSLPSQHRTSRHCGKTGLPPPRKPFFLRPEMGITDPPKPMPATLQLISLFESLGHHDYKAMDALAIKIVEEEESRGHLQVARKLRRALNGIGKTAQTSGSPPQAGSGFLLNKALMCCPTGQPLSEIRPTPWMRSILREILAEWTNQEALKTAGLSRRSWLLFHGSPGCGKTVTAKALAYELGVPAYVVRFDSLIGAYLGQM